MIGDRRPISIEVKATSGSATSSEAVSIGLIVTELVINALKHGFPEDDEGEILVSYDAEHSGWRLSVADNGSGAKEAPDDEPPHVGLGTSIVEALAHQLEGYGSQNWQTSGHHGLNYCPRSHLKAELHMAPCALRVDAVDKVSGVTVGVPRCCEAEVVLCLHLHPNWGWGSTRTGLLILIGPIRTAPPREPRPLSREADGLQLASSWTRDGWSVTEVFGTGITWELSWRCHQVEPIRASRIDLMARSACEDSKEWLRGGKDVTWDFLIS